MKRIVLILALLITVPTIARADFDDGFRAYKSGDYATALREFRPLAEQGHVKAQYKLGLMYETGRGLPEDDTEQVSRNYPPSERLAQGIMVLGIAR